MLLFKATANDFLRVNRSSNGRTPVCHLWNRSFLCYAGLWN